MSGGIKDKYTMLSKPLLLFAVSCLLWAGCSVTGDRGECLAPVKVHINDIRISQVDFPETKSVMDIADYTGVKTITLEFFKSDESLQYNVSQLRANTETYGTFSDFSLSLPYGTYDMAVIAHVNEKPVIFRSIDEAVFDNEKPRETLSSYQILL